MGYRVHFLIKGDFTYIDHTDAFSVDVKQNHLFLYDKMNGLVAVYQSGWWIKAVKIKVE